jgi:para-nitrobenzyl esterase
MTGVEPIELETPFGRLRGERTGGVAAFRRVPYAQAPIGERRFELPGRAPCWQGVRDAVTPGPIPPQLPSRLEAVMGSYHAGQSEDCLHLDIWTSHEKGDRAPVLVFVHGGAFMTGGGSLPCYDGSTLAKENGLVVVNITYRLGILGFWPQPDFGGLNLGLHDQVAALRWIAEAIGSFGGDPQNITIVGQSAGAFSIAALLGTDIGRGLFKRAVMMSAPVGIHLRSPDQARPIASALLDVLGLGATEASKLRELPVGQIFERLRLLAQRPPAVIGDITPPFMPVLDGALIPRDPLASIEAGSAAWCDVMIGVTREEYAAFSFANPALDALSEDALEELVRREVGEEARQAIARIRAERVPATPRTILGDLHTDRIFAKLSFAIAATQSGLSRNTYAYAFDWQSPNSRIGACHCIDLPFLFGNIDVWQGSAMLAGAERQEVEDLSRRFRGAVAAFAANGDPNGSGLPKWPAYGPGRAVLHFDRRITACAHLA